MNTREIGEIRRRTRRDRSNIPTIYGCYVNGNKEIVAEFSKSVGLMPENEAEKYFGLMKRTLSGTIGKNLIDISFQTAQVADSPEHKLLMGLRTTGLKDATLREELYTKIIQSVAMDDGFLILPITNESVINYIKSESCNFKAIKESYDLLYDNIELINRGTQVKLTDRAGGIFVINLESYIHDEIMNECLKHI